MNPILFGSVLLFSVTAFAEHIPNHFSDPCLLCKCFLNFPENDAPLYLKPYAVAIDSYNSTEDRCLATCINDNDCQAVVYGLIGGQEIFTCELYKDIQLIDLIYIPFMKLHRKISDHDCAKQALEFDILTTTNDTMKSEERRMKRIELAKKPNPFYIGK